MSKHTSGQWVADKLQDRDAFNIFVNGFNTAMCQVSCMDSATRRVSGAEVAANARLIAAAPDLLAAALGFQKAWNENRLLTSDEAANLLNAIAKAT